MPVYRKTFISNKDKDRFKRRLSTYLQNFVETNEIPSKMVADQLGMLDNVFSGLKNNTGVAASRFISSIDYLKGLASLEQMSLQDFITFIENKTSNSGGKYISIQHLTEAFEWVSLTQRSLFISNMLAASREYDAKDLNNLLRLFNASFDLSSSNIKEMIEVITHKGCETKIKRRTSSSNME